MQKEDAFINFTATNCQNYVLDPTLCSLKYTHSNNSNLLAFEPSLDSRSNKIIILRAH